MIDVIKLQVDNSGGAPPADELGSSATGNSDGAENPPALTNGEASASAEAEEPGEADGAGETGGDNDQHDAPAEEPAQPPKPKRQKRNEASISVPVPGKSVT